MFVGVMAFFARISDSSIGGTYMTLLNTFTNLGGNWPSWVALRFVSEITWTTCFMPPDLGEVPEERPQLPSSCYAEEREVNYITKLPWDDGVSLTLITGCSFVQGQNLRLSICFW